jgi:hypothetical protein
MTRFMRGLTAVLLCAGTLSVLGCTPDNETESTTLAKSVGDPGKPDTKGVPTKPETPPASQEEFGKRQQQRQSDMFKKGGYPSNR